MSEQKQDVFVTVVAPVVGGASVMTAFLDECSKLLRDNFANYEVVLVDGGADDDVIEALRGKFNELSCLRMVRLSQAANQDIMLFAGLESAIGDYVVVLMPTTDPPAVILDVLNQMRDGHDIVYGLSKTQLRRSRLAILGARFFYWYCRKYLGLDIPVNATYLVGLNRRSVNALTRIKGRYRHVRQLTRHVGFKGASYTYNLKKGASEKDRGIVESVRLASEIVLSYSHHPLRAVSLLGLMASAANLLYAFYAIATYLLNRRVSEGWTTLSLELAIMFFILFVILSVVCEYLGRILEETRAQPAYHIMEELASTVLVADETRRNVAK